VVHGIRRRAFLARISALTILCVLTGLGTLTAYFFLLGSDAPLIAFAAETYLTSSNITANFNGAQWISEITKAFVRIGSVLMAVFLVNILVSFARYSMRVANYLDSRADCLLITNGDTAAFAALLPFLSVDPLNFQSTPMNPYDSYLDTIKSILPGGHRTSVLQSERVDEK
jgi:hypothetical protein